MNGSRRQFIKSSLAAGTFTMLPFRFGGNLIQAAENAMASESANPIQNVAQLSSQEFNGDDIERVHEILWNVDGYIKRKGGLPPPSADVPVVIIGGGVAGLYAGYLLRDLKPLLLEQDNVFGGNSKGEQLGDSRFSIGAAYMVTPEKESENGRLLTELELWNEGRTEDAEETTVYMNDRLVRGFWQGSTDPAARQDFLRIHATLKRLRSKIEDQNNEEWQMQLDANSFTSWMKSAFGNVHPHIQEYFQLYAWSSFCASLDELSAYQMLDFITAETGSLIAFPGGNSAITSRLHTALLRDLGPSNVRSGCLAVSVRIEGDWVLISFADSRGELHTVRARNCVFAAPKFVARRIVRDLPPEQAHAMHSIRYRGYIVSNIILDRRIQAPSFELYYLNGEIPPTPTAMKPSPRPFTDICFGTWAQHDRSRHSILSVYKAFAFDGDRQFLFNPGAHDKHRGRIIDGIQPVLQALGLVAENVKGIRMTRWGHSMPVATTHLISSGVLERAHRPIGDKIFFANQDNWANPSFEVAADEARLAAQAIRRNLYMKK